MASIITHIKFALDVKENFGAKNLPEYLSGAVYPDTRYFTGVKRRLTHNTDFLPKLKSGSNFEKGWATHIICDEISHEVLFKTFPEYHIAPGMETRDWWLCITAIKEIQDFLLLKEFNARPYLQTLRYVTSPNNENRKRLEKYYSDLRNAHKEGEEEKLSGRISGILGLDAETIKEKELKKKKILSAAGTMKKIGGMYGKILKNL